MSPNTIKREIRAILLTASLFPMPLYVYVVRRHRSSAEDLKTGGTAKDRNLYCGPAAKVLNNAEGSALQSRL
jgi:hypothetical protein